MTIFSVIAPLIFISLLGFICAKKQALSEEQLTGLSKITFNLFIPAFLFYRMATADLTSQLEPSLFIGFYLPVLVCYGIAWLINYRWHHQYRQNSAASAVFALGASYSNTIIVGLPISLLVIGEQALAIIFLIVAFHSALLFALTGLLASASRQMNWRSFIKQNLSNPLVFSILSGLLINSLDITLPAILTKGLQMLGQPAITLALFILGASIARYQVKSEIGYIVYASGIKLIVLPALVYVTASQIFALSPLVTQVLVIISACPTGVNAYLIAQMHQVHRKTVASTVVVSTLASMLTLPCWLLFLGLAN